MPFAQLFVVVKLSIALQNSDPKQPDALMNRPTCFEAIQSAPKRSDYDVIDVGALFKVFWRNKTIIGAAMIVFLVMGWIYVSSVATPKFQATSVLLLDTSGRQIVDLGVALPGFGADSHAINTEVEILKSRRLLQRVVRAENLSEDPEFNPALRPAGIAMRIRAFVAGQAPEDHTSAKSEERAINGLLHAMTARNLPKTDVLQITVQSESPAKSAILADQIAAQYIRYKMDMRYEATREASEWLSQRVADLKLQLEQAETKVAAFSSQTDVVSRENVLMLERQLKDMRARLQSAQNDLSNAGARSDRMNAAQSADASEMLIAAQDDRLTRIFQTEGQSKEFTRRYATLLARTDQNAMRARANISTIESSLGTLENQIAVQSNDLIHLQQLARDAEANRLLYEHFLSRLKEASAQEGIHQPESRVLSNAVVPATASEPRVGIILIVSALAGLIVGSGGALFLEAAQNNYRSAAELEAETSIPVMGQIPLIRAKTREEALKYLDEKPTSAAAEAVRNLRTSVLLSKFNEAPQVIMSTSSIPDEGKTTVTFALANNLVGLGKTVLLVEGDLRRLAFRQYLETPVKRGLMSVLSKEAELEDAVVKDQMVGADILLSEPSNVNAADVLSSESFESFLETARTHYDHIIIDTPPALIVPDARIISPLADLILLTVHWNSTTRGQVADAIGMFTSIGQNVDGIVLNQINVKMMSKYGYGNSYGAINGLKSKYYTN
ncbi:polysaccharide biosynthesis tyrosine autokinase [Aliiroseovarius sp. KMU-50]|uniref:non-specific protein-tyrosine kinase n=1 Tax=Aliiroseovarius salicola TaxID=3009082 RepID=A0ABT4VZC4_9RHOB|nr:polysaccharide biosynthesis tyrosine autokinase [Aliiroseovarius sp. KMU-50]MDA5093085.1 polysaccharide biosynthesis tyrosine autokinase [Aliiroseovarius sp. KMU-50]